MPDEFLTVQEVADRLKLNRMTIRHWVDRDELPAVRVGKRRVRIRQDDLTAFLEAGSTSAVPEAEPQLDEGSVMAWASFGAAMAEASAKLEAGDPTRLADALNSVSSSANDLAAVLRANPS